MAACGGEPQDAGSLLHRGNGVEPESLDMHRSRSVEAGNVQRDLGEGLVGYDRHGALVPAAAERWEISDDALEYRFYLRPDLRWSNGDALTAEDFVYSFRRLMAPETAAIYAQSLSDIVNASSIIAGRMPPDTLGVEAGSERELLIRLERPVPYFLGLLTHQNSFPVHRGSVEAHGDRHAQPGNLVSNGPYRLVRWDLGAFIEIERNEFYWDDANTPIDRVRYHVTPEPMVELNRYRAGELHVTSTIPPGAFAQMRAERPDEIHVSPGLGVHYYGFNLTKLLFRDNPPLREALSRAVDREAITRQVIGRGEQPAYSWVPPGVDGYEPSELPFAGMSQAARNARAKQLYAEAGYGPDNPLRFTLRYNTSDTQKAMAAAIQSMWQTALGAEVSLINEEFQVHLQNVRAMQKTEMFRLSWFGEYNDAHSFLKIFRSDDPSNLVAYRSEDFDGLMRQAAEQLDPDRRSLFLGEAEATLLNDHALIPIYFHINKSMVSPAVDGWEDNVLNYHYSRHLRLDADP